jgi:hypothetical protein
MREIIIHESLVDLNAMASFIDAFRIQISGSVIQVTVLIADSGLIGFIVYRFGSINRLHLTSGNSGSQPFRKRNG